jgi:hypothetical protein
MLVVSIALAAVLAAGGDGNDSPAVTTATSEPLPTSTGVAALVPTVALDPTPVPPIPSDLQARLDTLPQKLRDETTRAYAAGRLTLDQLGQVVTSYENRNPNLRVGSVISAADNTLRFQVFITGEEAEVQTFDQTLIVRGDQTLKLEDLRPSELVMVVTADGGTAALTIEAFGVAAP